jgi:hypothetical protein
MLMGVAELPYLCQMPTKVLGSTMHGDGLIKEGYISQTLIPPLG